jgi:hypothetical protein
MGISDIVMDDLTATERTIMARMIALPVDRGMMFFFCFYSINIMEKYTPATHL